MYIYTLVFVTFSSNSSKHKRVVGAMVARWFSVPQSCTPKVVGSSPMLLVSENRADSIPHFFGNFLLVFAGGRGVQSWFRPKSLRVIGFTSGKATTSAFAFFLRSFMCLT